MSNCKSGDTAMVVRACRDIPCTKAMIGRTIVGVVVPIIFENGVVWTLDKPAQCPVGKDCQFMELPDEILQPLRGDEGGHDERDVLVKNADDALNPFVGVPPVPVNAS